MKAEQPLNEGNTRGSVKGGGVQKPTSPPPAPVGKRFRTTDPLLEGRRCGMKLKPCESVCQKCGWSDIHITYRPVGESLKYYSKYDSEYIDLYKVTKEHIHYQCTKCGYTWDTEPMNTHATDPLIEELAEKLADHYCKDELLKEMADVLDMAIDHAYVEDWDMGEDGQDCLSLMEQALQKYQEQEVK